jgi:hypothetical protein
MGSTALSFIRSSIPAQFELRTYYLASRSGRAYDCADWRGALVVVEYGQVELCGLAGTRTRLARGDVAWLADLPLESLYNPGPTITLLAAVWRRRTGAGASRSV